MLTSRVGIFFGSDTGNTEKVANLIQRKLGYDTAHIFNIATINKTDIERYNYLLLGIPTWYYGESQCDWDDFFPTLKTIDFTKKVVAIFGCGDQEDYKEYFCDAMGALGSIVLSRGATLVGKWPTNGYHFDSSKSLLDNNHFIGLVIDEDRQPELTVKRVDCWVKQIVKEMKLAEDFTDTPPTVVKTD